MKNQTVMTAFTIPIRFTEKRSAGRPEAGGFTLLELLLALIVFIGVATAMMVCFSRAASSDAISSENMKAGAAASRVMNSIRDYASANFDKTYAYYNANPSDDPNGTGTAPGNTVVLSASDAPGPSCTVRIDFPESNNQLLENITDADWAMPRDLNGDGSVGSSAVNTTYKLLPVRVVVTWQGVRGLSRYTLVTLLTAKQVQR
jgi:type II secretory pathway pseudopilin PulG